ncbi:MULTISPECIES: alpha/beta hydrolase family protein [unclassified Pseudidiomarina]|uniref:alpha/beta hydrolase family protein n=1 Tax=Pseudidiomarina salilacus TaxID=3384452 RepID=UPI00398481F1
MKKIFIALLTIFLVNSASSAERQTEKWAGHATLPDQQQLPLELTIYQQSYGATANVNSPAQGIANIPVNNLVLGPSSISMTLPTLGAELALREGSDQCWSGELIQGIEIPVEMCQVAVESTADTQVQELQFQSADGHWLSGSLYVPEQGKINTIALIAHGSGPSDRAGTIGKHLLYNNLARQLASDDIAVFSYDKRGIRRSQGNYIAADVSDFTTDYLAAYQLLSERYPNAAIGFVGHSEGSTVIAMAANQVTPKFLISLGGVGLNGIDAIVLQDKTESMAKGATLEQAETLQHIAEAFYQRVLVATSDADREASIAALLAELTPAQRNIYQTYGASSYTLSPDNIHDAALHGILGTDPTRYWRELCLPTLIMNGDKDVQVPAQENVAGLQQALTNCKEADIETVILPNYNHLFQATQDGNVELYQNLPNGFDTKVTQRIAKWIHAVVVE